MSDFNDEALIDTEVEYPVVNFSPRREDPHPDQGYGSVKVKLRAEVKVSSVCVWMCIYVYLVKCFLGVYLHLLFSTCLCPHLNNSSHKAQPIH